MGELRILLVDHAPADRTAVRRALAGTEFAAELVEEPDPARALVRLSSEPFDLTLIEHHLPGDNGLDLIGRVRREGLDVPVIALVARGDEELAVELMKAGASDYISKRSLSPGRLARSLRHALEMHRAQIETREAQEALRRAVKRREDVLASVSHELRNPLNAIVTNCHLLLALAPDGGDGVVRRVGAIQRASDQMQRLLDDLLDVSRIEAGRFSVELGRVEVAPLLDDVIELFRGQAEVKQIELARRPAEEPAVLLADRGRLIQVLSNLVCNALRFTPEGGRVTLAAERRSGAMTFSVADTGVGIDAADLPQIFDPFWQAPRHADGGAGLGLSIVRGIVEVHGGAIRVESEPGRGSTFRFTLPLAGVGAAEGTPASGAA